MKAWEIVGYAFDGAIYCPACVPSADTIKGCTCTEEGITDENDACTENCSGYGPNVIFACDEPGDTDDVCDTCGALVMEAADPQRCPECNGTPDNPQGCYSCCRDCGFNCSEEKDAEAFHVDAEHDDDDDEQEAAE